MQVTERPELDLDALRKRRPTRPAETIPPGHGFIQDLLDRKVLASAMLPGVQFTEPAGDPGWFGPDTPMWYLFAHPSASLGGFVSLISEGLNPDMAYGGIEHSDVFADPRPRAGRSLSFYWATVYGATPVAERVTRALHGYHRSVAGERPDGTRYEANDPDNLRWAHAGLAYGHIRGHRLYHPRPLPREQLDEVAAGFARIHREIGGTDLPASLDELHDYYVGMAPKLALTPHAKLGFDYFFRHLHRPGLQPLRWGLADAMPWWARDLYGYRVSSGQRRIGRSLLFAIINSMAFATGTPWYVREASQRISAKVGGVNARDGDCRVPRGEHVC